MKRNDVDKMEIGPDRVIQGFTPKFRSLEADWDDYISALCALDDMGKIERDPDQVLYFSHGKVGMDWLEGQYMERRLYDVLEAYHLPDDEAFIERMYTGTRSLCETFASVGEAPRARRIWRAHVAGAKSIFWSAIAERDRGFRLLKGWAASEAEQRESYDAAMATIPESKATLLGLLQEWHDFVIATDPPAAELERIEADIQAVKQESRPRVQIKPDKRKMDEDLFWELIGDRQIALTERLETLPDRLSAFGPTAIRAFDKTVREKAAAAYRQDVWALAYLLQGGCSDDAFAQFRGWLILQGQAVFEQTLADPDSFDVGLHSGIGGGLDGLLDAAPVAYEMRSGKAMRPNKIKPQGLAGPDWDEATLSDLLPKVSAGMHQR